MHSLITAHSVNENTDREAEQSREMLDKLQSKLDTLQEKTEKIRSKLETEEMERAGKIRSKLETERADLEMERAEKKVETKLTELMEKMQNIETYMIKNPRIRPSTIVDQATTGESSAEHIDGFGSN